MDTHSGHSPKVGAGVKASFATPPSSPATGGGHNAVYGSGSGYDNYPIADGRPAYLQDVDVDSAAVR